MIIHDVHNASAVLRTADAVGVLTVHLVYSFETPPERAFSRVAGAGASKWIELVWHETIGGKYDALRIAEGYAIYATALHADSVSLYEKDYTGARWRSCSGTSNGVCRKRPSRSRRGDHHSDGRRGRKPEYLGRMFSDAL
ncbi:MAG: TrmH family RNA methyltransferase [Thermomicrobiales bacterium]